jgi:membrane dipeptidase
LGLLLFFIIIPMKYLLTIILLFTMAHQKIYDYKIIHYDAIVVDGHNDVSQRLINGEDIGKRTLKGHIDLERMKDGGVDAAFFSVWVPPEKKLLSYYRQANQQIDSLHSLANNYPDKIQLATNVKDLPKIISNGKIAMMISMEGAHPIGDKLERLEYFYKLGVRSIMPTWNNSTSWATSATDESQIKSKLKHRGLTELGKKFIRKMDVLGIIVDVSHSGEQTFWDIIKTSKNPIIASHSCVWNICQHLRNLTDDQIKAIAKSGGVVGVNFAPWFLDSGFKDREIKMREKHTAKIVSLKHTWKGDSFSREIAIGEMLKSEYEKILPTLNDVVDHIDYIVKLVGVDYVGLGSDFDGIGIAPKELKDVSYYPLITKEFVARGYNETDINKILGGNLMRVIKKVLK